MKKYKLLKKDCVLQGDTKLYRIKALRSFSDVNKGDLGGYVEKEDNLSHDGDAWIYNNARVWGKAWVFDNATVWDTVNVFDAAMVGGGGVKVCGTVNVFGNTMVSGDVRVGGDAWICDDDERGQK